MYNTNTSEVIKMEHIFKSVEFFYEEPSPQEKKDLGDAARSKLRYKTDEAMEHRVTLSLKDLLFNTYWLIAFCITLLTAGAVLGLGFGLLAAGGIKMSDTTGTIYAAAASVIFIAVWAAVSLRGTVKKAKAQEMEKARGTGNYKMIDIDKWDHFAKMANRGD